MSPRGPESGAATAETAVALPALVLVLTAALAALALGIDHVRCLDAARGAARLLARGEAPEVARAAAARAAPAGAAVVVTRVGADVRVVVTGEAPAALAWWGDAPRPVGRAEARVEGVDGGAVPGPGR